MFTGEVERRGDVCTGEVERRGDMCTGEVERRSRPDANNCCAVCPWLTEPSSWHGSWEPGHGSVFPFSGEPLKLSHQTPLNDTSTSQCQGWNEAPETNQSQLHADRYACAFQKTTSNAASHAVLLWGHSREGKGPASECRVSG